MKNKLFVGDKLLECTKSVLHDLKANYNDFDRHIILVPDRDTMQIESMLFDILDIESTFKIEVLSFNRLVYKSLGIQDTLDKQGGIVLINKICSDNKDKLKFFGKAKNKIGFATNIYETIMQIKSSNISVDELQVTSEDTFLIDKMKDIAFIYKEYERYLENGLTDGFTKLNIFLDKIKDVDFSNTAFYIVDFDSMTRQNLQIIERFVIDKHYISCGVSYGLGKANEHIYIDEMYYAMKNIFDRHGGCQEILVPNKLDSNFSHIIDNCFSYSVVKKKLDKHNIELLIADGEEKELEQIAIDIKKLLMKGYRFKDIAIAVSDFDSYYKLRNIFDRYNYSYYLDESIKLSSTELSRFIISIIQGVYFGFTYHDWQRVLFNHFFNMDNDKKEAVVKYINKYRPIGYKWLDANDELDSDIKQEIKEKLLPVINKFTIAKSANEFVSGVNLLLQAFEVEVQIEQFIQVTNSLKQKKILSQIFTKLCRLLQQVNDIAGDTEYTLQTFCQVLNVGLESSTINLVPLAVDSIYVGEIGKSFFEERKVLYVLGVNAGRVPSVMSDCGIISDNEIDKLSYKYKIEPKIEVMNARMRQKVLQLLVMPKDKLVVSYLTVSDSGEELKPSLVVNNLRNLFYYNDNGNKALAAINYLNSIADNQDMEDYLSNVLSSMYDAKMYLCKNAHNQDEYTEIIKKVLKEKGESIPLIKADLDWVNGSQNLVFKGKRLSISQISDYYSCPYKFFLKRVIKLKTQLSLDFRSFDVGNFLHRVAELYCNIAKNNTSIEDLTKVKNDIFNKVLKEYKEIEYSDNKTIKVAIKKEAYTLIDMLNNYFTHANFKPDIMEYSFKDYPLFVDDVKYKFDGKIDRVDTLKTCNNEWFIVVDYKTGNYASKIDFKNIYYGEKLQLLMYAKAYKELSGKSLMGFGYYPITDKYENQEKEYKINGFFIEDEDVLGLLDSDIVASCEDVGSKFYNINKKITKNKVKYSSCISVSKMSNLANYAYELSALAIKQINRGYCGKNPSGNQMMNSCEYCDYNCICPHEFMKGFRKLPGGNFDEYFEMKKEVDDGDKAD